MYLSDLQYQMWSTPLYVQISISKNSVLPPLSVPKINHHAILKIKDLDQEVSIGSDRRSESPLGFSGVDPDLEIWLAAGL